MLLAAESQALPAVGIPLGTLIGVFSGVLSLLFLRTLQVVKQDSRQVLQLIGEFVGTPTLWFSVPFGCDLVADVDRDRILTSYVVSLAIVWVSVVGWPLLRLIVATGNEIE